MSIAVSPNLISSNDNFFILDETDLLCVGHFYEDAYLLNRSLGTEMYLGDFYGDPIYGLISSDNSWCVVGGATVVIWRKDIGIAELKDGELQWAGMVKQASANEVWILTRSTPDVMSVWSINVYSLVKTKVKDFEAIEGGVSDDFSW